jgi:hypothetical protein
VLTAVEALALRAIEDRIDLGVAGGWRVRFSCSLKFEIPGLSVVFSRVGKRPVSRFSCHSTPSRHELTVETLSLTSPPPLEVSLLLDQPCSFNQLAS